MNAQNEGVVSGEGREWDGIRNRVEFEVYGAIPEEDLLLQYLLPVYLAAIPTTWPMYEAAWNAHRADDGLNLPEWDSAGCVVKCSFIAADIAKHIEGVRARIDQGLSKFKVESSPVDALGWSSDLP